MALGGTGLALPRFAHRPRLVAPQIFVGVGYLVGWGGLSAAMDHELIVGHALVVLGVGVTWLSRTALPVRAWSVGIATALVWSLTALLGVGYAFDRTRPWPASGSTAPAGRCWPRPRPLLAPGLVLKRRDLTIGRRLGRRRCWSRSRWSTPSIDESARIAGGGDPRGDRRVGGRPTACFPSSVRLVTTAPAAIGSLVLLAFDAVAGTVALARIAELGTDRSFAVVLDTTERGHRAAPHRPVRAGAAGVPRVPRSRSAPTARPHRGGRPVR